MSIANNIYIKLSWGRALGVLPSEMATIIERNRSTTVARRSATGWVVMVWFGFQVLH